MNAIRNFFRAHRNKILNVLAVAAPIVAGVASGGVFTLPVFIAAGGALAGKLAQTPLPPPVPVSVQDALDRATGRRP